jgi:hypothetical protein
MRSSLIVILRCAIFGIAPPAGMQIPWGSVPRRVILPIPGIRAAVEAAPLVRVKALICIASS